MPPCGDPANPAIGHQSNGKSSSQYDDKLVYPRVGKHDLDQNRNQEERHPYLNGSDAGLKTIQGKVGYLHRQAYLLRNFGLGWMGRESQFDKFLFYRRFGELAIGFCQRQLSVCMCALLLRVVSYCLSLNPHECRPERPHTMPLNDWNWAGCYCPE